MAIATFVLYLIIGLATIIVSFLNVAIPAYILSIFVIVDFVVYIISSFVSFGLKEGFDNFKLNLLFFVIALALGFGLGIPVFKLAPLMSAGVGLGLYCMVNPVANKIVEIKEKKKEEEARRLKKQKKLERKAKKHKNPNLK